MRSAALLLTLGFGALTAQTPKYSVKGQVVDIVTGSSIGDAVVILENSDYGNLRFTCDQTGVFDLEDRRHITHRAIAVKEGYQWLPYPDWQKDFSGHITSDASGDVEQHIMIRLTPLASLQVIVADEKGRPADLVEALLLRVDHKIPVVVAPIRASVRKGRAEFNKIIPPGKYLLRIDPLLESIGNLPPRPWRYITFFYPAETDSSSATKLEFAAGESKPGISLRLLTARTYTIRGRIASAVPPRAGQTMRVSVVPG